MLMNVFGFELGPLEMMLRGTIVYWFSLSAPE